MTDPHALPLTVLGGFLGAGKTTLLNRLLQRGERYAVLVNDFGAISIDASLVRSHDGLTLQLENGCVCCTLADGLMQALERVLHLAPPPRAVIVEASGVGDPWRIAELAFVEPAFRLAAVIGLVDAAAFLQQLDDPYVGDTVAGQLRRCDLVLLNKADLVTAPALETVRERAATLWPRTRLVACSHARIPDELVPVREDADAAPRPLVPDSREDESHTAAFRRWNFRTADPLDRGRLEAVLNALPPAVLRLKGFCRLAGEAGVQVVQAIGPRWSMVPLDAAAGGAAAPETVLTVIGTRELPPDTELAALFRTAVASAPQPPAP